MSYSGGSAAAVGRVEEEAEARISPRERESSRALMRTRPKINILSYYIALRQAPA